MTALASAILLGLMGSLHCIGMCGPIALALPLGRKSLFGKVGGVLYYNFGRIIMYSLFGLLFGFVGERVALAGFQQALSITLGVLILFFVLVPSKYLLGGKLGSKVFQLISKLRNRLAIQFRDHSSSSLFVIGLLNGLLPCGLVYIAIAGAVATGDVFNGMAFMTVFGAGTIPLMLSVSLSKNVFSINFRNKVRKAVPLLVGVMAILLVIRGLNLGIPYLSPAAGKGNTMNCCMASHCKK